MIPGEAVTNDKRINAVEELIAIAHTQLCIGRWTNIKNVTIISGLITNILFNSYT